MTMQALDVDGSDVLNFNFYHYTEYDPDVVFYENTIFSAFCAKCCFFSLNLH